MHESAVWQHGSSYKPLRHIPYEPQPLSPPSRHGINYDISTETRLFPKIAMKNHHFLRLSFDLHYAIAFVVFSLLVSPLCAADLTVELTGGEDVTFLGAIARFDADGNLRKLPDAKAKIDSPAVDAVAERSSTGTWTFKNLPADKYDFVLLLKGGIRIEGFQFAPVKEFDPFLSPDAKPDDDARQFIVADIEKSQHYENKVESLYLSGDKKTVRILVQLLRDKPTSYEADSPGAATLRHEI
jgi:hypothetical protein